jgi:hypothetical protein
VPGCVDEGDCFVTDGDVLAEWPSDVDESVLGAGQSADFCAKYQAVCRSVDRECPHELSLQMEGKKLTLHSEAG